MTQIKLYIYALCMVGLFALPMAVQAQEKVALTIAFSIPEGKTGTIMFRLFNETHADAFPGADDDEPYLAQAEIKMVSKAAKFTFPDLPQGLYAVSAFLDENGNRDLDTNFVGMPTESFGMSNNVRGSFGPPEFSEAAISVMQDTKITIELK